MSAREDLLQASLDANWGLQIQLAWTEAFFKNLSLHAGRLVAIKFRFSYTPQQALDQLKLLLPLIDQTYPEGSFQAFLTEVVAADQALAND
jgi:hypothetical protein